LAEKNFPKIREARAKQAQKEALVDVARYTPFSEFSVSGGLILAPTVSGTSEYSRSTDTALTKNMGLAWQLGLDGALPLYTFGKVTHAVDAAEAGVRVSSSEVDKERNELRLNVRKAFYGVLLARDAIALVDEAAGQMDKYIVKLKEAVEAGDGDDIQLLKLQVFRADLTVRRSEAEKQEAVALSALRFLVGDEKRINTLLPDEPLAAEEPYISTLGEYLAQAQAHRPEVAMVRAAVDARKSQVKFEKSKLFPDLGLGLSAKWAYAPEVTDQKNPFVRDNGNFFYATAGLVVRYKLDFLPQAAKISQAKSQLEEVIATEQWARSGIEQQVTEAYAEVREKSQRLAAIHEATKLSKQWLLKVQQGIEVGTMDEEDIVDPAKEYARERFAEMLAIYEHNVALAKLAQTTGTELER
jgi:outer membrane protein TolC